MIVKLLPLLPPHKTYIEPFCGGASLFFAKPPSPVEVLNDLDKTLISFFAMLRDPIEFEAFHKAVSLTPYSRVEYNGALATWEQIDDKIERLRRWFVANRQVFAGAYGGGWGRSVTTTRRGMSGHVSQWLSTIDMLPEIAARLLMAQLECSDYEKCITLYDTPETLFYLDPPYLGTREAHYKYEMMSADQHRRLVRCLLGIKGMAVLSGYQNEVYERLERAGWERIDFEVSLYSEMRKGGATRERRVESVWRNPRALAAFHNLT